MALIESIHDAVQNQRRKLTQAVSERLWPSVRAVLRSKRGQKPEIVGSCMLLQIDESRYVVTAAHILDELDTHEIFVSGAIGTEPVQIAGQVFLTVPPPQGRSQDKIDVAFRELDAAAVERLGDVSFVQPSQFSHNRAPLENRFYLAMGYPASKNKRNVNFSKRSIKPSLSKYTSELSLDPSLPREYGVSGNSHLFLKFKKFSTTDAGEKRKTFKPVGLSGGPLVDLGDFSSPDRYAIDTNPNGYIAGMVIEQIERSQVIVATKIQAIVDGIRSVTAT